MPDSTKNRSEAQFTTMEKVACVALSILIGVFTAGIGGVIAFYVITAAVKAKKINLPQPRSEIDFPRFLQTKSSSLYPTSIQNRRFPPIGPTDTAIFKDGQFRSVHPEGVKFYRDHEILKLHPSIREINLGKNIRADITDNGKVVIQQQATRGCTAAVAAMLIHDAQKSIDLSALRFTNIGNTRNIENWITKANLTPRVTDLGVIRDPDERIITLQKLIRDHGSAIVSTDNDVGCHVIVVDEVRKDSVRLRDPYHGWEITVTINAFLRGFQGEDIIQIAKRACS